MPELKTAMTYTYYPLGHMEQPEIDPGAIELELEDLDFL
jgi:hypothetical protein